MTTIKRKRRVVKAAPQKKVDYIVFIGRMQPPHAAHIEIVYQALEQAETVIILVGSANQPRTPDNPWNWKERADMIRACFPADVQDRLKFRPISDKSSNTQWALQVQEQVQSVIDKDIRTKDFLEVNFDPEIKLIGHKKDRTSFYLEMFPQWKNIFMDNIDGLHATDIRKMMFEDGEIEWGAGVPSGIRDYIQAFMLTEAYENLWAEYFHTKRYKRAWDWNGTLDAFLESDAAKNLPEGTNVNAVIQALRDNFIVAPYAPTFNTVDAVVVQSGHILLVRRRAAPGKGLWALPGGFLNHDERIATGVIRELREETKIKTPQVILESKIENGKNMKVFDDPKRSARGRTITFAHYFELQSGPLPKVKGSDDAEKAKWIPLSVFEKMEDQLFEDHFRIANSFLNSGKDE